MAVFRLKNISKSLDQIWEPSEVMCSVLESLVESRVAAGSRAAFQKCPKTGNARRTKKP